MSTLKEQVEKDNANVFLNLGEFGEIHELNGISCHCILQGDAIQQTLSIGNGINKTYPTIYGADITVNVKKADLEDDAYLVESVKEDMGMLTIGLVANDR